MEQLFVILKLDLSENATEGAGWYIQSILDGQASFHPVNITPSSALDIAASVQKALQVSEDELPPVSVPQLVQSGSKLIEARLREELKEAEEAAAKVAKLRRRLNSLSQVKE